MRHFTVAGLSVCLLFGGGAAQADSKSALLFSCSIGAKHVDVTKLGDRFTYRFGTAGASEMSIMGEPGAGNIFQMRQRFTGPESQVRFTKGEFSYIVFAAEGNPSVGARSIAGVTVMRGLKSISSLTCDRFTEFNGFDEAFSAVPEDTEAYSGM